MPDLVTARLRLPLITTEHAAAVSGDRRQPDWADDYPSPGDRMIAGLFHREGVPTDAAAPFGHRRIVEHDTGLVVGGIGFHGPPQDGRVEVGYGLVESRYGRGYATEALRALITYAFTLPAVLEVVGNADLDNPASQRVMERAGMVEVSRDETQVHFRVAPAAVEAPAAQNGDI